MYNDSCIGCKSLIKKPYYRCLDGNDFEVLKIAHGGCMPFPKKNGCFK